MPHRKKRRRKRVWPRRRKLADRLLSIPKVVLTSYFSLAFASCRLNTALASRASLNEPVGQLGAGGESLHTGPNLLQFGRLLRPLLPQLRFRLVSITRAIDLPTTVCS